MAKITDIYMKRIKEILKQSKKAIKYRELYQKVKGKKSSLADYKIAIDVLKSNGVIYEDKYGIKLCKDEDLFRATVTRINQTFGFVERESDNAEIFIPGKYFLGAMPGDVVLARIIEGRNGSLDGEVVSVIEENFSEFTGTIQKENGRFRIAADKLCKLPLAISGSEIPLVEGEKVLAKVAKRANSHFDLKARIIASFGSSSDAVSCSEALIYTEGVEVEFPQAVISEALAIEESGVDESEFSKRLDLRDEIIFTIDGADTKDIDDAISVKRNGDGYELGVHIADVSHYVKPKSELDNDAFERGTSIYYANKVIPMLPKELSNGICSLNPNENRLAFSCLMKIDSEGQLVSYKFSKTVIKSRVKGVYSEINKILSGDADDEILQKYDGLTETISLMSELAKILTRNKLGRGAPQIETIETKLCIDENDVCVDIAEKTRGESELIIEEFMLMANISAAKLAKENAIPFVYRVHEDPSSEKIEELISILLLLNIVPPKFSSVKPSHLAEILEKTKGTPYSKIVNNMVLRSMAKAKYSDEPLGHFGLVVEDYSHFTSPIRRYPDLAIHRILTEFCYEKKSPTAIQKRFKAFAADAAFSSSKAELRAMRVERGCNDCFVAEYMRSHLGEEFVGEIVSVQEFGMFVMLPNTVEGMVRRGDVSDGPYDYDGHFSYTKEGKNIYRVGDTVKVLCTAVNVASGQIDFDLVSAE